MTKKSIQKRYDDFAKDAQELLERAGLASPKQSPKIYGREIFQLFDSLAKMHFPEDNTSGNGPVGLIRNMVHGFFDRKPTNTSTSAAEALAEVVKAIIKNRPPLDIEEKEEKGNLLVIQQCPFFEDSRNYTVQKKTIFVLMPFHEEWSDRIWREHIRVYLTRPPGIGELFVRRADDMFGQGVMEDVFNGIVSAELIVAECTGRNPNVLYELGMAHTLGKRTVLLSQSEEDIPFDLRRFRFCIYNDNSSGYPILKTYLQETAKEIFGYI